MTGGPAGVLTANALEFPGRPAKKFRFGLHAQIPCNFCNVVYGAARLTPRPKSQGLETVVVTARRDLKGSALTSSQGVVVNSELALTPAFRPASLLETVPGPGRHLAQRRKARRMNISCAVSISTMAPTWPCRWTACRSIERTHAHGQGYTDLNFMIPEMATNIQFTKGPYFCGQGRFRVRRETVDINYLNTVPGTCRPAAACSGFGRVFGALSRDLATAASGRGGSAA